MDTPVEQLEHRVRQLEALVSGLQGQIEFLLKINGLELSALRTATNDELLKHYQDSVQLLGIPPSRYPEEVIGRWAEILFQLSEFEFTRLQSVVSHDHTWEPFYHLAIKMMTSLRQRKDFLNNNTLQQLYAFLDKTRRSIRDAAIIMIKKYPDTVPEKARVLIRSEKLESYI